MATQTATPRVALSAKVVGHAFVLQYYHIVYTFPELAYKFYKDSSVLTHPDHNGVSTTVTTVEHIKHKLYSLDYPNCKVEVETADAQDSYHDGVMVFATGSLTGKDNRTRRFIQSFFLAPQERGYFVLNDVLRYVEACEPSENAETSETGDSSTPLIQDQAPPHAINPEELDQVISHEAGGPNLHEHLEEERQDREHLNDSKASENEAEEYSIFINNLPPNMKVDRLEREMQRFGPIKQNGVELRRNVVGNGVYAFVEFEELSSMQNAIQASPIKIGLREAIVEKRISRTRVHGIGSRENRSYSVEKRIRDQMKMFQGHRRRRKQKS